MTGLRLTAADFPKVDAIFAALEQRMVDTSPLMDRIGQAMVGDIAERFETETAPDGSSWAPSLRARLEGGKTLTKSARLRGSMSHRFSHSQAEAGTNVIYGGAHNDGATIRAKGGGKLKFRLPGNLGFRTMEEVVLPKREFIGLSRDGEVEILAQAEDYIAEVLP